MNDAFRALTKGVRFGKQAKNAVAVPSAPAKSLALPAELDLLGTGSSAASTSNEAQQSRKRKRETPVDRAALARQHKIKYTAGYGHDDDADDQDEALLPVASFDDFCDRFHDVPDYLNANWEATSYEGATPVQMAVWPLLAERRDVLCCAPTGSGKTLAFVIPLLAKLRPCTTQNERCTPKIVVLEPTRELAVQVAREAVKMAAGSKWSVQGPPVQEHKPSKKKKENKEARAVEGENWAPCDVLVTTPLRLVFAVKAGKVDLSQCEYLVLDEADQLFELNFVTQTDEIVAACPKDCSKAMFSATLPSAVEELARSIMRPESVVRVLVGHKDSASSTIEQSLLFAGTEDHKLLTLRSMIAEGGFTPPVLIFVQSIVRAKELATALAFEGINASAIHADLTPSERDALVRSFAAGQTWCLIATDVMARGLDFERAAIELVVNYDLPQSAQAYIHRIGRTGRAGKKGRAVTLFTRDDAKHVRTIVNVMKASGQDVPAWMMAHLPKPSKKAKKQVKLRPVKRKDVSRTTGAGQADKRDRRVKRRKRVMGGEELASSKKKKEALLSE